MATLMRWEPIIWISPETPTLRFPQTQDSSVDFPAPDGPIIAVNSELLNEPLRHLSITRTDGNGFFNGFIPNEDFSTINDKLFHEILNPSVPSVIEVEATLSGNKNIFHKKIIYKTIDENLI